MKQYFGPLFVVLSLMWFYLAFNSWGIGKTGIAMIQLAAGVGFMARGVIEWRKRTP